MESKSSNEEGGANWVVINDYGRLRPGGKYNLSLMVKGDGLSKAFAGFDLKRENGKWESFRIPLPTGTFPWRSIEKSFSIPLQKKYDHGFRGIIGFSGNGSLYVDHFILTEVKEK